MKGLTQISCVKIRFKWFVTMVRKWTGIKKEKGVSVIRNQKIFPRICELVQFHILHASQVRNIQIP